MDLTNGFTKAAILQARAYQWWFQGPAEYAASWVSGVDIDTESADALNQSKHHCLIGDVNPIYTIPADEAIKRTHGWTSPMLKPHKHMIPANPLNTTGENVRLQYLGPFIPFIVHMDLKIALYQAPCKFYIISDEDDEVATHGMIGFSHIAVAY